MGFLCAYASFTWKEELEGQNIVALDEFTCARKPGSSIPKDNLSLNRLSYQTVIWIFIILTITYFPTTRGWVGAWGRGGGGGAGAGGRGGRGKIPWPGQLAPYPEKTWQNVIQILLLLNKNLYDRNMVKLFFMHICIFYPIEGNWVPEYNSLRS